MIPPYIGSNLRCQGQSQDTNLPQHANRSERLAPIVTSMLSNLLPGLRELRAPLAAGVLWLLAAWMAWEPHIPSVQTATGGMQSVYRLRGFVPELAVGAVAGFLAYLVGSVSVAVFSGAIKSRFPVVIARRQRRFNTLTPSAVEALYRIAADTRHDIEELRVLPAKSVIELVKGRRGNSGNSTQHGPILRQRIAVVLQMLFSTPRSTVRRWREAIRHAAAPPPEAEVEQELAELAVSELDVVTTARLLGKDPDLYSAIDRHRAEVEFRVAVMPPLLALFVAVATRVDSLTGRVTLVVAGTIAVTGLCWDALKQRRQANGLLIDAASDGRVRFPSLERLGRDATRAAQMSSEQAADAIKKELKQARHLIGKLDSFAPSALAAVEATEQARRRLVLVRDRLSPEVRRAASECVDALEKAAELWNRGVHGDLGHPWTDRGTAAIQDAERAFERFKEVVNQTLPTEAIAGSGAVNPAPMSRT